MEFSKLSCLNEQKNARIALRGCRLSSEQQYIMLLIFSISKQINFKLQSIAVDCDCALMRWRVAFLSLVFEHKTKNVDEIRLLTFGYDTHPNKRKTSFSKHSHRWRWHRAWIMGPLQLRAKVAPKRRKTKHDVPDRPDSSISRCMSMNEWFKIKWTNKIRFWCTIAFLFGLCQSEIWSKLNSFWFSGHSNHDSLYNVFIKGRESEIWGNLSYGNSNSNKMPPFWPCIEALKLCIASGWNLIIIVQIQYIVLRTSFNDIRWWWWWWMPRLNGAHIQSTWKW